MGRFIVIFFGLLALGLMPAFGAKSSSQEPPPPEGYALPSGIYTDRVIGDIHTIDLVTRTAIISGYLYSFSGLSGYERPSIKLYGSQAGSLELLAPKMRVRIDYVRGNTSRTVITLQEVDPNDPANAISD
jgi:hypothetical protein